MNYLTPVISLNKAFLKVKLTADQFHLFKINLTQLITHTDIKESEEYNKNLLIKFLRDTYYQEQYLINTKDKQDLVIYHGKNNSDPVNVIFETKKISDKKDFPKLDDLNCKALQQLLYYYLQERVINKNLEVKHLIITNNIQWFIFDAQIFEKYFINDKILVKQFTDFSENRLTGKKTDYFYQEIAFPALENVKNNLIFTYLNLTEYQDILLTALSPQPPLPTGEGEKLALEKKLIPLYKIFTPEHLLKLPFANDSNSLNKAFYSELLYLLGLTEVKEGNKKLIQREKEGNRNQGSLLENALSQIKSLDKLSRLENVEVYGENEEEQLFNLGLELIITWINRILFLKLLEAQLISYHSQEEFSQFVFLNINKINNYEELNSLFFQVLACKIEERETNINQKWGNIPYLNSSLFEVTEIEHQTIVISNLKTENLPIFKFSVLKDSQGKKQEGYLNCLEYLFNFLDSYDFGNTSVETFHETSLHNSSMIQDNQKRLINASVLGLIFEKINGYKDGSFFTPGFITMYMCKETIRRSIIQKFNDLKNWNCQNIEDLYNKIEDKIEANTIINSLKICDPAVGSGHFLVSALNEIIAIKSELKILLDKNGKTLRDYQITVENDELIIINEDGEFFTYNPNNKESQRVQETLFHEKQSIIENCLFGVDINSNSVKICRLRLWIELLKNSYYKIDQQLETLPNIDINIKWGNSLISRFGLDENSIIPSSKNKSLIADYKKAVKTYFNAENKTVKRQVEKSLENIKNSFLTTLQGKDPKKTKLRNLEGELFSLENPNFLLPETAKEKKAREKKINQLQNEIDKLNFEIEEIESGKLYQNAFEWRFEFPEVLNDQGYFIGFDVVIGNPPYVFARNSNQKDLTTSHKQYFYDNYNLAEYQLNLYPLFVEKSYSLLKQNGCLAYIIPNNWLTINSNKNLRKFILNTSNILIVNFATKIFESADVDNSIIIVNKSTKNNQIQLLEYINNFNLIYETSTYFFLNQQDYIINISAFKNIESMNLLAKIESKSIQLKTIANVKVGLKAYQKGKGKPPQTEDIKNKRIYHSKIKINDDYIKYLDGKDVCRYYLGWSGEYLKYGNHLAEARKDFSLFSSPRILVRQIPSLLPYCINACLTKETVLNDLNSMNIINIKESPELILGILNSKLISYWFAHKFGKLQRGIFPQFKVNELGIFPMPKDFNNYKNDLIKLVNEIIKMKKNDPHADTSKLEKEIDLLVYKLYELTEAEIKIVEGN